MSEGRLTGGLAARLAADLATLDLELTEVDLLIAQATSEAERHEQKRVAASDRLTGARAIGEPAASLVEQAVTLVTLTRRAALMEAQVEVLNGKRKVLARYRDTLAEYVGGLSEASDGGEAPGQGASSRGILAAQEDLRREIARAMHDGPAQSLTNIVLQAQIVERLVERDPGAAQAEVRELIAMVQRTLDATKSFIFDVRPMVLDDLGLVPTLRGAARDRSRRARIPVTFESFGTDRRLPTEVESGLFRLLDDSLAAYLAIHPGVVALRLDWSDQLEAQVSASPAGDNTPGPVAMVVPDGTAAAELPPALVAMIAQRRDDQLVAAEEARRAREIVLPQAAWGEIRTRAEALGMDAELLDDGSTLRVNADLARVVAVATAR